MDLSPAVQNALQVLQVDRTTIRVSATLQAAGIDHVLLKGPSTAAWLYADPRERGYVDTDLLVASSTLERTVDALLPLGLAAPLAHASEQEQDGHSVVLRPGPDCPWGEVDVHHTLPGVAVGGNDVWGALTKHLSRQVLLNQQVTTLDETGRALVVLLHAARNGLTDARSTQDLRLLLQRALDWGAVRSLASELQALPAMARALRLTDEGGPLLAQLGLEGVTNVEMELRDADAPALAYGLARLAATKGIRARAKQVRTELWPTPAFLEYWAEREGLAPGRRRLQRAEYVLRQLPRATRVWWSAQRRARSSGSN